MGEGENGRMSGREGRDEWESEGNRSGKKDARRVKVVIHSFILKCQVGRGLCLLSDDLTGTKD